MNPEQLEAIGGWVRVIAIVGGLLAAASFVVWLLVGAVLWFVRGTRSVTAADTEPEWFEQLPEDHTPRY